MSLRISALLPDRSDRRQVMCVEHLQPFQHGAQQPGDRNQLAGNRRGQSDAVELIVAAGEQAAHFRRADAARLPVRGVEPEIVPQDHSARLEHPQHLTRHVALHAVIQDRGVNGVLQRQVEGTGLVREVLPIGAGQRQVRQPPVRFPKAVRQQISPVQAGRGCPISQIFQQHPASPTANFQHVSSSQRVVSPSTQQAQNLALALLVDEQIGRVEKGVDVAARQTPLAVGVFEAQAGQVVTWRVRHRGSDFPFVSYNLFVQGFSYAETGNLSQRIYQRFHRADQSLVFRFYQHSQ